MILMIKFKSPCPGFPSAEMTGSGTPAACDTVSTLPTLCLTFFWMYWNLFLN